MGSVNCSRGRNGLETRRVSSLAKVHITISFKVIQNIEYGKKNGTLVINQIVQYAQGRKLHTFCLGYVIIIN